MTEVFLRRLSRWQAEQQRESVADLYVAAYEGVRGAEPLERGEFLRRFAQDVQRPGFDMVIAGDPFLVGCAYGYPPGREGEWWHGFRGAETDGDAELATADRVFALAELMVLPSRRRTGIATRLQQRLLERQEADILTALITPDNAPAAAAYRSWGWTRTPRPATPTSTPPLDAWSRRHPG
ncbi:GNAT family N-acetyltransferase [Streptomyces sp. SDr-06]|uniref:GNAT family N-acetyltransferase n=1 Tax=Streptomyces sp. SDr-06 TaxID=2267702 RepID=UPI0016757C1A|nr:GNAT family N-acetyltransferase [Streptomyces sp. SDr-06]